MGEALPLGARGVDHGQWVRQTEGCCHTDMGQRLGCRPRQKPLSALLRDPAWHGRAGRLFTKHCQACWTSVCLRLSAGMLWQPRPPPTSTFRPQGQGSRAVGGRVGHSPRRQEGSACSSHHPQPTLRGTDGAVEDWAELGQHRHGFLPQEHCEPGGLVLPKHTPEVARRKL